ncbi:hypothetical protein BH23CHL8_BH23CHL8_09940 [soil metagenome]
MTIRNGTVAHLGHKALGALSLWGPQTPKQSHPGHALTAFEHAPEGSFVIHRSFILIASLLALLILSSAVPAAARAPMALGASVPGGRSAEQVEAAVTQFSDSVGGNKPAAWSLWSQWGSRGGNADCLPGVGTCSFPSAGVAKLHERGITPVVWWEPLTPGKPQAGKYARYKRILNRAHDAYIKAWAKAAKQAGIDSGGRKVILRFAHEANGHWFPWGIGRFDNTVKNFKNAWRYVWRKFENQGALPYVDFLWSVTKQNCKGCNPFAQVYPGGKWVDYAGVTAFNWGSFKSWKSMNLILQGPVGDLMKVTKRPIIVSELASHFKGGNKANWIRKGYNTTYDRWPRVKAVMYLNTDDPHKEFGHPDWRLVKPNDGSALDAYTDIASKGRFKGDLQ